MYLGLHKDNTPLAGWNAVLHTLTWKFILIAFTRIDTCGEKPDPYKIAQSVLYRSATRLEAYAHRIKAQQIHAASQLKLHMQQPPARTGPIKFTKGGFLDTDAGEHTREPMGRRARWMRVQSRPLMIETLRKPKTPRLLLQNNVSWISADCSFFAALKMHLTRNHAPVKEKEELRLQEKIKATKYISFFKKL